MNGVQRIAKSTLIYLLGSVLAKLVSFFMLRIYTTHISPTDFGTYDVAITYVTLVSSILYLDIWNGIMRFMFDFKEKKEKMSVVASGIVIFAGSSLLFVLLFAYIANFLGLEYRLYVLSYGIILSLQNLFGYIARALGYNSRFALSGVIATLINASLSYVLIVIVRMDYKALYISYILGVLIQCLILNKNIKIFTSINRKLIQWHIVKRMLIFSLPLSVNSASYWMLTSYGKVVISQNLGTAYNGYYAVASKFGVMITLVSLAFSMAWQEMAFNRTDYSKETSNFYAKATVEYIKAIFSGFLMVLPMIYLIFPYFVEKSYHEAGTLIPIYILATLFSILSNFLGNILTAYKRTTSIFISTLIASIVNIIFLNLFINSRGLISVPVALLLGYLVNSTIRVLLIKRIFVYKLKLYKISYYFPITLISMLIYYLGSVGGNVVSLICSICFTILIFQDTIKILIKHATSFWRREI